jgi:hypothetical protein
MYTAETNFVKSKPVQQDRTVSARISKARIVPCEREVRSDVFKIRPCIPKTARLTHDELEDMAKQFADKVLADVFSPSEIQGFLLGRKTDPVGALQDVENWMAEQLSARATERT